ncbi:hypothetical protein DPEC_G00269560 [Dallia pectoralis]|uniref:Uncharacterized protein n=1 Tax=Dallia pectoralis TaxID=75939 RepID=A0ACC2FPC5_DALPE|nr:hypothetical protein DPEC_G00269560 [Dallia pectoralis]
MSEDDGMLRSNLLKSCQRLRWPQAAPNQRSSRTPICPGVWFTRWGDRTRPTKNMCCSGSARGQLGSRGPVASPPPPWRA